MNEGYGPKSLRENQIAALQPLALPALKRIIKVTTLPGALKRSFPRMNAGVPLPIAGFQFSRRHFIPAGNLISFCRF